MNCLEKQTSHLNDVSLHLVLLSAWSQASVGTLVEKYEAQSRPWIYGEDTGMEVEIECLLVPHPTRKKIWLIGR